MSQVHRLPSPNINPENKAFWDSTPSGTIELLISNEKAWTFVPGQEYYVDFTLAEVAAGVS